MDNVAQPLYPGAAQLLLPESSHKRKGIMINAAFVLCWNCIAVIPSWITSRVSNQEELAQQLSPLLIDENAQKVRLVLKYHHQRGEMDIRATDDVVCLKFHTTEHRELYESEKLVQSAMAQMCNLSVDDITRQREKLSGVNGGKKKKKKSVKSS